MLKQCKSKFKNLRKRQYRSNTTATTQLPSYLKQVSFSKLDTYLSCPKRFQYQYIEKLPSVPNIHMIFGKALHAAAATFAEHHMLHDDEKMIAKNEDADLLSQMRRIYFKTLYAGFKQASDNNINGKFWLARGLPMLQQFYQQEMQLLQRQQPIWAERKFSIALPAPWEQVQLIGYFDRVDVTMHSNDNVIIIEYKTKLDEKMVQTKHSLQVLLYMYAYEREFGYAPAMGHLQSFTTGQVHVVEHNHGARLLETEQFVVQTVNQIYHDTEFVAKPHPAQCKYCPFASTCPYKLETMVVV
jgi:CRISPR/Cas system-associated exonuclease Cas4 (RecB family)